MRLAGYKRTKLAPGVTRYQRKPVRDGAWRYDTELPWVVWCLRSTDREARFTGRMRVDFECAVCGERKRLRLRIPRFGDPNPSGREHPARSKFKLDHLHRDRSNPMGWAKPLLNPAAHDGGVDLDLLAMRLQADLEAS